MKMATPWNETKIVKMYDTGSRAGTSNTRTPACVDNGIKISHIILFSPVIHVSPMTVTSDTEVFNQELHVYIRNTSSTVQIIMCLYKSSLMNSWSVSYA